uniref:Putative ubiquitin family protein n=1 Tax=Phyllostachys edulis TaxID=38705 RepID=D3IVK6_PHYED|nr:putative ubiquitin family protein [Phyllostachys edulis]
MVEMPVGGSVPVASTNPSEPVGAQQAQERTDRTGNASHANISNVFAGVTGGAPFSVESGVRLLPLRTVVAVPAGISRAPLSSSSGGAGAIYPLLTRIQQRANANGSDARNGQSPNEPARSGTHVNQQPNPQSSQAREADLGERCPLDSNKIVLRNHISGHMGIRYPTLGAQLLVGAMLPPPMLLVVVLAAPSTDVGGEWHHTAKGAALSSHHQQGWLWLTSDGGR